MPMLLATRESTKLVFQLDTFFHRISLYSRRGIPVIVYYYWSKSTELKYSSTTMILQ